MHIRQNMEKICTRLHSFIWDVTQPNFKGGLTKPSMNIGHAWESIYPNFLHWSMTTSSNGNIFRFTGPLCGEFNSQRPVTRSFDVFSAVNKRLSKQSWGRWFETPSRSLWRHCNASKRFLFILHNPTFLYEILNVSWEKNHTPEIRSSCPEGKICTH